MRGYILIVLLICCKKVEIIGYSFSCNYLYTNNKL